MKIMKNDKEYIITFESVSEIESIISFLFNEIVSQAVEDFEKWKANDILINNTNPTFDMACFTFQHATIDNMIGRFLVENDYIANNLTPFLLLGFFYHILEEMNKEQDKANVMSALVENAKAMEKCKKDNNNDADDAMRCYFTKVYNKFLKTDYVKFSDLAPDFLLESVSAGL